MEEYRRSDIKEKKLVINESEADIVRDIFSTYIEYNSLAYVYKRLKDNDLVYRNGKCISKNVIWWILRNVVYTGKLYYGGKIYQGIHEPIISDEVFKLAQKAHREKEKFLRLYKSFPLGGILTCSECGSKMTPTYTNKVKYDKRKRYYYYRCTKTFKYDWQSCSTRTVSAPRLENLVFGSLKKISQDEGYLNNLIRGQILVNLKDRTGLELTESYLPIDDSIISNSLKSFLGELPKLRGVEKNLWVKQFIKKIDYAKDQIAVTLYYTNTFNKDFVSEGF